MATTTTGFHQEGLSVATQDSVGVQFLQQVVDASTRIHQYRYEHREVIFKGQNPHLKHQTIKTWLHGLWEGKNRGTKEEAEEEDDQDLVEADEDADSEEADWSTDDDSQDWETRLLDDLASGHPGEPEEDEEWDLRDDIELTA